MGVNKELASCFSTIAALLELTGADRFRVNAHQRAARVVDAHTKDLCALALDDPKALEAIEGIGKKSAAKIREFAEDGTVEELKELESQVPSGVLDVMEVPGLGPKTTRLLWQELDVTSQEDLKRVIDNGSILDLPRMGKKTVENISKSLEFLQQAGDRMPIGIAYPLAIELVEMLRGIKGAARVEHAGSLRRGRETIGDIDILATSKKPEALHEAFRSMEGVTQVLVAGDTKSSVRLAREDVTGQQRHFQADLRTLPDDRFGAAWMYFTGSKEHNVVLRERALAQGMTLNEYGLFPEDDDPEPPQNRGIKPVASKEESDIYEALGMAFVPPEMREDAGEFRFEKGDSPTIISLDDIVAELHAHTTASDGRLSIEELACEARDRGFHTIAVTDHSKSQTVANGLDEDRLRAHIKQIHDADKGVEGIRILAGSEVDILPDGAMDYDDDLLDELDIVVASPHWALQQKPEAATKRLLKAIEHPKVRIIGHPTGRMIGKREGLTPDLEQIFAAAREHHVALEINAHWRRLDLRDTHVRAAVDAGVLIAINCDVHTTENFGNLRYGVLTARRGWLPPEQCVNTWPAERLGAWITSGRDEG
ncbi:MAG: DNA polymerase/3'-5' exonuclease PolX [Planctomycetota bacterium]|jgi:DNA polymerase (family 10)